VTVLGSHDILIMVAYVHAALIQTRSSGSFVMDAMLLGIAPGNEIARNPALLHFSFRRHPEGAGGLQRN
jgi:hypothetical protein